jgi:hypothetical protein
MAAIAQMQPSSQVLAQDMLNYNNPKLVYVQQAGGMLVASQPPLQQPTVNNGQVVYLTRGQQAMAVPSNTLQGNALQPVLPQAAAAGPRPMLQQQQQQPQQQAPNLVYVNVNGALKPAVIQNGSIYLLPEAPAQPQQVQMATQPTMGGGQVFMQQQQPQQQQQQQVFTMQGGNLVQQQQLLAPKQGQPLLVQLPQQQPAQVVQQHPQLVAVPRPMVLTQAAPPQQRVLGPAAPVMVTNSAPGLVLQGQAEPRWIATSSAAGAPQLVRLPAAQAAPLQQQQLQQQQQQQQFQQPTVMLQTTGALPAPVMPIHSTAAPRPAQLTQLQPMQLQAGVPSSGVAAGAGAGNGLNMNTQQLLMQPMVLGKAQGGVGGGPATIQISASAMGAGQPGMLALSEGLLQPLQAQQQPLMVESSQGLGSNAPAGSGAVQPSGAPPTSLSEQQQQQTMYLTNLLGIGNAAANLAGASPQKGAISTGVAEGAAAAGAAAGLDTRRVSDAPPATSMALLLAGLNFPDATTANGAPVTAEGGAWALAGGSADVGGGLLGGAEVVAVGGGSSLQQRLHGLLAEEAFKAGVTLDGLQLPAASIAPPAASAGTAAAAGADAAEAVGAAGGGGAMEGGNAFNAFGFSFFSGALSEAPAGGAAAGPSPTLGGGNGALGALLSGLRLSG